YLAETGTIVVVHLHGIAIAGADRPRILDRNMKNRLASLQPHHGAVLMPLRMDAPPRMAADQIEGMFAADRGRTLVAHLRLVRLDIPGVIDGELQAPRRGRIGHAILDEPL